MFQGPQGQALRRPTPGSNDFGMLFLGFSSFLIIAALLLVGLMVRLNLDQRAKEIGLLLAVGWRRALVRRLILAEGLILAGIGGIFGVLGAVGYAKLLLDYLGALWPGGLEQSLLTATCHAAELHHWLDSRPLAVNVVDNLVGDTRSCQGGRPPLCWQARRWWPGSGSGEKGSRY